MSEANQVIEANQVGATNSLNANNQVLDWTGLRRLLLFCLAVLGVFVVTATIYGALMLPILVSAFLTYLLLPLVDKLELKRVPRSVAALSLILGSTAVVIFGVFKLAPVLYQQMLLIAHLVPDATRVVQQHWLPFISHQLADLGVISPEDFADIVGASHLIGRLTQAVQANFAGIWKTGTSLAGGVIYIVLLPVVNFFMLKDYPAIAGAMGGLVPQDLKPHVRRLLAAINRTFRSVLKGQAIVAGILGVLYIIGFNIVGLQSAFLIGIVAGVCRIIPYLDVIVGGILTAIVLLSNFSGWGQVLGVVSVFVVVQAVDGALITPRVLGDRVGIHPLVLLLSVLAFADWFGFWGVLLAVPVSAMVKVLLVAMKPYYLRSRAYLGARGESGERGKVPS